MPTKHRSRKTRRITHSQRGGAYVGHGTYGCGFRPALRCNGEDARRPGKFSKLVSKDTARDEIQFRNLLIRYDPDQQYFLYPETICRPAPYEPEDLIDSCPHDFSDRRQARVIVLSKGGRALSKFQPLAGDYPAFFNSFLNLFEGLQRIHNDGIAHNDIKPDNVVTRRKATGEYVTRFIDFGLMVNGDDLAARAANPDDIMSGYSVLQSNYLYWSFDMRLTDPAVLASAAGRSASTRTRIDKYYDNVTDRNDRIPYKSFDHPRMSVHTVSQIAQQLHAAPLADRHKFIMTMSDVLGLGLTLAETYYRLTGHADRGEAVPFVKIVDGFTVRGGATYTPVEGAMSDYNAADRAWHISVRNNISIPLYQLVRRMITANLFDRIPLPAAAAAYAMLVPRMAAHFTEANIMAHLKPGALVSEIEEPVDFAAVAAPASSSPAAAAAEEAVEAEDVLGFAHSPMASPRKASARSSGSWHEVVRRRRTRRRTSSR
jgi:hypothetical protein